MNSSHYLEPLFSPRSIAVVGASSREGSLGAAVFDNLRGGGFAGPLHAVNPKYAKIGDAPCHSRLDEISGPVDLAVVVTPAATVPGVLRDAARASIRHAVVLTAGFGETGVAGKVLESELLATTRELGIRLVGPNCLGLMRPGIGVNASFARNGARPGGIALVSQSGAICTALTDWAWSAGIGFSSVISMGAAIDLDFGEILDYLLHDVETRSILLYVEGIHEARRFIGALRAAARTKPVVVLKVGRHSSGAHAAMSHTGTMVGNDAVFDAVLRRCGAVRVGTYMELFSAARLLGAGRMPQGKRLAVLTNGGGPGVMAADCASDHQVELAMLTPATMTALDARLPVHWSHANPVDIIGDATPARFAAALEPLLADPNVDGVLTLFCPQRVASAEDTAKALLPLTAKSAKPVLTAWLGEAEVRAGREIIENAGMPAFQSPESGVIGFSALAEYWRAQQLLLEAPPPLASSAAPDLATAHAIARAIAQDARTLFNEPESKRLLACFGIPVAQTVVATTLVEAIAAGERMGFPLAIKIVSPDIAHKSDVQGVTLGIRNLPSLEREFRNLLARVAHLRPAARIEGVAIQTMIEKRFGRELMIGVTRDPVFGQVISFGAGGVAVELLRDYAVGLPPLNARLADDLIARTRIARLLGAHRHIAAADRATVIDALIKVSDMVCALPWLREMDINPLSVDDRGAIALDARVVLDPTRLEGYEGRDWRYPHLAIHPYPSRFETGETLRDGTQIALRPVRPEDAAMEQAFVKAMSEESRYTRFFNPTRSLAPRLLARLTQLDYERELALLALHEGGMVGVARYSPNADGTSCEFAVAIADAWHGRGVATLLMQRLIAAARDSGYRRMVGTVLGTNHSMHKLMSGLGFDGHPSPDDHAVIEYSLELAATAGRAQSANPAVGKPA